MRALASIKLKLRDKKEGEALVELARVLDYSKLSAYANEEPEAFDAGFIKAQLDLLFHKMMAFEAIGEQIDLKDKAIWIRGIARFENDNPTDYYWDLAGMKQLVQNLQ